MNLKKIGKVFTSKFAGTGPSSYEKRIYRAAVSQRSRNTGLDDACYTLLYINGHPYYANIFFLHKWRIAKWHVRFSRLWTSLNIIRVTQNGNFDNNLTYSKRKILPEKWIYGWKHTYNVTLRRVNPTIVAVKKAIIIIYSLCVFVALSIQHAKRMYHIVFRGLFGTTIYFHLIS